MANTPIQANDQAVAEEAKLPKVEPTPEVEDVKAEQKDGPISVPNDDKGNVA
jgi:hypothetical protein